MSRRVPLQQLRGSDPVLLEVQIQDLLRRPFAQLEPLNALDLFALAEHPDRPAALARGLEEFLVRSKAEVGDLPNGKSLEAFVEELSGLPADRVPANFRAVLQAELERTEREKGHISALLSRLADVPPTPFVLGARPVKVVRAAAVPDANPEPRMRAPRGERGPAPPKPEPKPKAPRAPKPVLEPDADAVARAAAIKEVALDRVGESGDTGLLEAVLVAGIRFRLRDRWPMLPPHEVIAVLKTVRNVGRVRWTAGRYQHRTR